MNIMGIGPMEMAIIAVVALMVVGPAKLPEFMGQAGKMVRDFRKMSAELTGEFEKTIAEARDATSGLSKELTGMSNEVKSVTNSVKKDLNAANKPKPVNSSRSKPPVATKSTTTTSKAGASKSSSTTVKTSTSSSASKSTSTAAKTETKTDSKAASVPGVSPTATTSKPAVAKKVTPIASREDPVADLSLFEPELVERPRRQRRISAVSSDPTPRLATLDVFGSVDANESADNANDDALARSRARRRSAGYGQRLSGQ